MIFAMVSTKSSAQYTMPALTSFFATTRLRDDDRFVLIENDPHLGNLEGIGLIRNAAPKSFASNCNFVFSLADEHKEGVVVLNNDIIFAEGWLDHLPLPDDRITLPCCNQQARYSIGGLTLQALMDLDEFNDNYAALNAIAAHHRAVQGGNDFARELLMPFYCFHLPYPVRAKVGQFDESFGNGGEDVDYRLRAMLAGFDVAYGVQSFVLHFMGKSTWRSAEAQETTAMRARAIHSAFAQKWGADTAETFLAGGPSLQTIERLGLRAALEARDYRAVLDQCRSGMAS